MRFTTAVALATLCLSTAVEAHSVVTEVKGANGINGVGMGVTDVTGKKLRLFNQASRYVKGDNSLCGSQKLDGKKQTPINKDAEIKKSVAKGLPTPDKDGVLKMTMFQVNADGAGPFKCEVSPDDNGGLVPAQVTKDVPGTKGKSNSKNKAFPFEVKVPTNLKCKGPGNSCILRCKNAIGQPFGGCVVFKAPGGEKRSLFGRLAVDEDPEDVDTDEVESFDTEETLDHHTDEAEEPTSENLDDLD